MATTVTTTTATNPEVPPFRLDRPKYDQSTFAGRFRHFVDVIDPRTLFTSSAQVCHSPSPLSLMAPHCLALLVVKAARCA